MIKYKLKALLEQKIQREGRTISLSEVAREIGIQRAAMSKIAADNGYVTTTTTLDKLCAYFDCEIAELVEYCPDNDQ